MIKKSNIIGTGAYQPKINSVLTELELGKNYVIELNKYKNVLAFKTSNDELNIIVYINSVKDVGPNFEIDYDFKTLYRRRPIADKTTIEDYCTMLGALILRNKIKW